MAKNPEPKGLELSAAQFDQLLSQLRAALSPGLYERVEALLRTLQWVMGLLQDKNVSLRRLQRVIFGDKTEKTATVCPSSSQEPQRQPAPRRRRRGHGRHGHKAYTGARRIPVRHPTLEAGRECPDCQQGKLRRHCKPATALRFHAQPPISATVHEMEVLRCALCGKTFTAPTPPEAGSEKYDPSVGVMIGLMRYGSGMPFYRLAQWQRSLGIPLPASTQWELAEASARHFEPVVEALVEHAAQARTVHNDDTPMRVWDLRRQIQAQDKPERTGIFTTGVVAQGSDHRVALFMTGRQHAGENLAQVLRHRAAQAPPPLQMCDGLSRNEPKTSATTLACCLAHGRRGFVDVAADFPAECRHVLETLREVYRTDAQAKEEGLDPLQRLQRHQARSQPLMDQLHDWLERQLADKRVEPNSGLGDAIEYMLDHWVPLTRFLHEPGAPLDNNICELILKTAILHRKNSLAYKTQRGAQVGDIFMSLIQTCRLNRVNPFEYLMALVRHADLVKADPVRWLPWNYPQAIPASDSAQSNTG